MTALDAPNVVQPSRTALWSDSRLALPAFLIVFTYIFIANSWVGDDAYISFRVVDNVVHGYGLTYNPPERVQAYTHPLWLLLHLPAYLVTGEVFYTTLALSYACGIAAFLVLARAWGIAHTLVLGLLVLSSKAFVDYTSSGLENPLSHLLLAIFYARFLRDLDEAREPSFRHVVWYTAVASLAFVNRIDSVLLYLPALAWLALRAFRSIRWRMILALVAGGLPVIVWEVFALVYYGFALPNTYYAKIATGIPEWLLFGQGLSYVLNSLAYDPITLAVTTMAIVMTWATRRAPFVAVGVGLALSVLYTIWVGGDHMSGRFFTAPFFVSALVLVWSLRGRVARLTLAGALVAYNLATPLAPIKSTPAYQQAWAWRETNGIQDERGYYHRATNLLLYNPLRELPDHEWYRQGLSFARGGARVSVQGSIGFFGFQAGPDRFVVDQNALSDPLLARLPVSDRLRFAFYVGHYERDIPEGYLESCADGTNHLTNPLLRAFYDRLLNVTRGPIWSRSRFADIWRLNVGRERRLHIDYNMRRKMDVSVPATNERLRTDTGVRDYARLELRTSGEREGYLQYGPNVPLRAGTYRVRWFGVYDGTPAMTDTGFVEVWVDGRQIVEEGVRVAADAASDRTLAEITFALPEPAAEAELRLYLHAGVRAVLQRLEIQGQP